MNIDEVMAARTPLPLNNVIDTAQTATIHHLTTMLAASKNALFPSHSHLLTTSADDLTL